MTGVKVRAGTMELKIQEKTLETTRSLFEMNIFHYSQIDWEHDNWDFLVN